MSKKSLANYPVVVEIPVQWGELDAYGHLNNTAFFRYFESVRIRYLERCGFYESMERDKIGAILHSTSCRFRRPLFYPDTARVGARVTEIGDDRFIMQYEVASIEQGATAAEGSGIVVSFDYENGVKVAIPPRVRALIEEIEQQGGTHG